MCITHESKVMKYKLAVVTFPKGLEFVAGLLHQPGRFSSSFAELYSFYSCKSSSVRADSGDDRCRDYS